MKRLVLLFAPILLLISCEKSEKYYITEEEAAALDSIANPKIYHAVFNISGDIYYAPVVSAKKPLKRLTNSELENESDPRISPDHSKVAFRNANGETIIMSLSNGVQLEKLTDFVGYSFVDWLPNSRGLYFLINNEIKFSKDEMVMPTITLGPNDKWLAVGFAPNGNFHFLITEKSSPTASGVTKLYYFDPSKNKFFLMNYDAINNDPYDAEIAISSNGDLTLMLATKNAAAFSKYYVYPAGSLAYTVHDEVTHLVGARYNEKIKQGLILAESGSGNINDLNIKNYLPYGRSNDRVIDSTYFMMRYKGFAMEFDWK